MIGRFAILNIGSVKILVIRNEENRFYISTEELYDINDIPHRAVGHGGHDKLLAEASLKKDANVTKQISNLYLSMHLTSQEKKIKNKRGLISKAIFEMNYRFQVNLIDLQTRSVRK